MKRSSTGKVKCILRGSYWIALIIILLLSLFSMKYLTSPDHQIQMIIENFKARFGYYFV